MQRRAAVVKKTIRECYDFVRVRLLLNIKFITPSSQHMFPLRWYRDCLVHFARLAYTLLKDGESARDNYILACNFAKYLPI